MPERTSKRARFARPWVALILVGLILAAAGVIQIIQPPPVKSVQAPSQSTEDQPATDKPTQAQIDDYGVAADEPRIISIPAIGVRARVFAVGIDQSGRIDIPANIHDVGWFNQSAKPSLPGATVVDGHLRSSSNPGVFTELAKLKPGDRITVERGDRTVINYTVQATLTYDHDKVDMAAVSRPVNGVRSGLNLITCGGNIIQGAHQFDKRVVVFAGAQ